MREIKFRAWNKKKKSMITVGDIGCFDYFLYLDGETMKEEGSMYDEMDIPYLLILMQYTGLKDKNGKEIYEGDILKWFVKDLENMGCVVYEDYDTAFSCKVFKPVKTVWVKLNAFDYEVIGNIYENPDLLQNNDAHTAS